MATPPQTIVIKVGTSSLVDFSKRSVNIGALAQLCEAVRNLKEQGHKIVLVSSGAVGVGCLQLGLEHRPTELARRQALAAAGQIHLMRYYDDFFSAVGVTCAQVMLSLDNLANLNQYTNTCSTFEALFSYNIVPVVNENDTVAVEELRFGDNDTLSAKVATAVRADWLFLMTDVDALYTSNPVTSPDAQPIHAVHDIGQLQVQTDARGSDWGTGGMTTKLTAARLATSAGCNTVICQSSSALNIERILQGEQIGTVFYHHPRALKGKKRWILMVPVSGEIWMDEGAVHAVRRRGKSLFSAGIVRVTGDFNAQDCVLLCDAEGNPFAQGLTNYSSSDISNIKGKSSAEIGELLGFCGSEEVLHRDNISMTMIRNPGGESSSVMNPADIVVSNSSSQEPFANDSRASEGRGLTSEETFEDRPEHIMNGAESSSFQGTGDGLREDRPVQTEDASSSRPEWNQSRESRPPHVMSPRSDSAASLTPPDWRARGAEPRPSNSQNGFSRDLGHTNDNSLSSPSQQRNADNGLRTPPLQQWGSQGSLHDDRPNPLPSPASGFSRRPTQQRVTSPPSSQGANANVPDLIIPSESSFSSEQPSPSGDGAAMPADIQRVLSPEHASAAVMSSRGPIREATEAEIAARRALIAAAKAGATLELSPKHLSASTTPSGSAVISPTEPDPATIVEQPGDRQQAGAPHQGDGSASGWHQASASRPEQSGASSAAGDRSSTATSTAFLPNATDIAAAMRMRAAGAAEGLAGKHARRTPSYSTSSRGKDGGRNSREMAPSENFRPLSTANPQVRGMYSPMHNFANRPRSSDIGATQSQIPRPPTDLGGVFRGPRGSSPPSSQANLQSAATSSRSSPAQIFAPAPGPTGGGPLSQGLSSVQPSHGSEANLRASSQTPDPRRQADSPDASVESRLAILREREQPANISAKQVAREAGLEGNKSWMQSLRQAIAEEKSASEGGESGGKRSSEDITDEGWMAH